MTRDALDLILKIWDDPKPGLYEHKFWRFTIPEPVDSYGLGFHMKPYQKAAPPIGVAGVSSKSETLVTAGERGYIPMSVNIVPTRILKEHGEVVQNAAQKAGRTPDSSQWRIAREMYIADTTKQARQEAIDGVMARDFREYFFNILPAHNMINLVKTDPGHVRRRGDYRVLGRQHLDRRQPRRRGRQA